MTRTSYTRETGSVTHPNGTKFTSVANFIPVKLKSVGWVGALDPHGKRGVRILYPCGTKRFISNDWYN